MVEKYGKIYWTEANFLTDWLNATTDEERRQAVRCALKLRRGLLWL